MKKKGVKKYILGIEGAAAGGAAGASGAGAAGATNAAGTAAGAKGFGGFMGNYGGMITQAASSLMPLLMKKPDPNAKPYKKGSKLIKYQEGSEFMQSTKLGKKVFDQINAEPKVEEARTAAPTTPTKDTTFEDNKNLLPEDLLSKKDRMISKLPKFIQKTLAGKAKGRIDAFQKDYDSAKSNLFLKDDDLSVLDENRIARKIVSNRKNKTTDKSNYTPEEYPDIFERSKGKMGSSVNFGEHGPGKKEYVDGLKDYKKRDLRARLEGIEAMEKYDANEKAIKESIASGTPASLFTPTFNKDAVRKSMEKEYGGPVSTKKAPISYEEKPQEETKQSTQSTKQSNPYIAFKNMSAADQKKYRAGMAGNEDFEVGGRTYKVAVPKQRMHSERMQRLYEKNPAMYNKLITKTSTFKEGTKEVKAENPRKILKGKNGAPDTLYNKNTGKKIAFISGDDDNEKVEKKVVKKQAVVKTENKTTTPKPTENKGLYQGNKTAEALATAGAPAVAEVIKSNPTSKTGKTVKNLIKYGPAVGRFVYDAAADKINTGKVNWKERSAKFAQDVAVGTATSGAVKTARGARKNYKEQESAAAKETENPIAPSRKEALKVGANEAVDKATVAKLPKRAINFVKDVVGNSPQGKQAKINIKNANANKAAVENKFSGKGDSKIGKEGQYYIQGKPVEQKSYINFQRTSRKTGKINTKEKVENLRNVHAGFDKKQSQIEFNEKATQKALDDKYTGSGSVSKGVGVEGKYYIDGAEVSKQEYNTKYRKEIIEERKQNAEAAKQNIAPGTNVAGPNVKKPTPIRTEISTRRRTAAETERMRQKGFTDKEGKTPAEYRNYHSQEKNRIETQPKPSNMTDEEFAQKKQTELEGLNKTKEAYMKGLAENKAAALKGTTTENKPEIKVETPETTVKPKKERASRGGATQENPNALTEQARVTETTETTKKKKTQSASTEESNTGKNSSGPTDGPTMNASELGIVGKKKRGSQKANGARLIKYK